MARKGSGLTVRWYYCPVVTLQDPPDTETGEPGGTYRAPKVMAHRQANGQGYMISSVMNDTHSLSAVVGTDFSSIDADPQCFNVLKRDYENSSEVFDRTPRQDGWNNQRTEQMRQNMESLGCSAAGLTRDTTFRLWLERFGKWVDPNFTAQVFAHV